MYQNNIHRHRPIIEEEPLPDADFLALKKSLNALQPIREYRLRTAERECAREKKKLQSLESEIENVEARLRQQNQTETEQRRTLSAKNQAKNLSLKNLQNWLNTERSLIHSTSGIAAEREQICEQKRQQQQVIEQANQQLLNCHLETERLKIMIEEFERDHTL